jgi:peroxiredoxin
MRWLGLLAAVAVIALLIPVHETTTEGDRTACDSRAKPADLNFTLKDINGQDFSLAAQQGKVILLSFWATWCGPCKIEIPWFIELQAQYQPRGLMVVGVSVDDPVSELKPFADRMKMNYPVLVGDGRDDLKEHAYGPMWGIPTAFLIGRDGKICRKHMGISTKEELEQEIKALL